MYKVYDKWPEIAHDSYYSDIEQADFKDIKHIVFTGMGGSGAIGDLLSSILSKTPLHISIVKGYHLPNTVSSDTLIIATSVSGNTMETFTVLDNAIKNNLKAIAFSSGGLMEKYCTKNKIPFRNIAMKNSPRASFPSYIYSILHVLKSLIPVKTNDIAEFLYYLKQLREKIGTNNLTLDNLSLDLAEWLSDIAMIYYPHGLHAAAIRFKNSLQENTKTHAMAEDVIEACHNGIMSWETKSNVRPLLIEGTDDYIKTKQLWKILKEYFEANKIDYKEIFSVSGSILTKLMCLIYMLDFATIYRSIILKQDPTPVTSIDYIKKKLYLTEL